MSQSVHVIRRLIVTALSAVMTSSLAAAQAADQIATYRGGKEDDTKPVMMKVKIPGDFGPEAVFAVPGSSSMMLLSDDGTDDCKDADKPQKSFRALTLPAPK